MSARGYGWETLLEPDETVLWQDHPQSQIIWKNLLGPHAVVGVLVLGAGLAVLSTAPGFGFGLMLFGVLLGISHLALDAQARAGTSYLLTSKHVYSAELLLGQRRLEYWRLQDISGVTLIDGHPGDVIFELADNDRRTGILRTALIGQPARPGFRQLSDPRRAYQEILRAQERLRQVTP